METGWSQVAPSLDKTPEVELLSSQNSKGDYDWTNEVHRFIPEPVLMLEDGILWLARFGSLGTPVMWAWPRTKQDYYAMMDKWLPKGTG